MRQFAVFAAQFADSVVTLQFAIFSGFPNLSVSSVDSVNQVVIKRSSSVNY
jgi:hypothetical protein